MDVPFIESVQEDLRPAVTNFVTNSGASAEELGKYANFSDFLSGYKPAAPGAMATWKAGLGTDIVNSPTVQKFEDTPEGLRKAVESHLSLEKLLGHEKVPIPKGPDDTDGWNRFSKAMGIPDKADAYGLPDAEVPESLKGMTFDKAKFAEVVHSFKLTPDQAKGLWGAYTNMVKETYDKAVNDHTTAMTEVKNKMLGEWGDTYEHNVELGQLVINKFSADQETQDFLTAALSKDPRGIKFLAKVGAQFAENKVGDFARTRFTQAPEEAQAELDKILKDTNHPYNSDKATEQEHNRAIDYVNSLYGIINKAKGQA